MFFFFCREGTGQNFMKSGNFLKSIIPEDLTRKNLWDVKNVILMPTSRHFNVDHTILIIQIPMTSIYYHTEPWFKEVLIAIHKSTEPTSSQENIVIFPYSALQTQTLQFIVSTYRLPWATAKLTHLIVVLDWRYRVKHLTRQTKRRRYRVLPTMHCFQWDIFVQVVMWLLAMKQA